MIRGPRSLFFLLGTIACLGGIGCQLRRPPRHRPECSSHNCLRRKWPNQRVRRRTTMPYRYACSIHKRTDTSVVVCCTSNQMASWWKTPFGDGRLLLTDIGTPRCVSKWHRIPTYAPSMSAALQC